MARAFRELPLQESMQPIYGEMADCRFTDGLKAGKGSPLPCPAANLPDTEEEKERERDALRCTCAPRSHALATCTRTRTTYSRRVTLSAQQPLADVRRAAGCGDEATLVHYSIAWLGAGWAPK